MTEPAPRIVLPGISPRAYEHPADRGALAGLRAVPGLIEVLRAVSGFFPERADRMAALASCVRVGDRQHPALARIRDECARTLDLPAVPELFVQRSPAPQAMAIGLDRPFLVITTGVTDALDEAGLRFVLGHECGHVLSDHAALRTLLLRLLALQYRVAFSLAGMLGVRAVIAALTEWFRKAELTADRAGLLCAQDPGSTLAAQAWFAGAEPGSDPQALLEQAEEYLGVTDLRDSLQKLLITEATTHPMMLVRAAEVQRWAASADYRAILAGDYPRRMTERPQESLVDELRDAARSYRDATAESPDALNRLLTDFGRRLGEGAGKVRDAARRFTGRGDA